MLIIGVDDSGRGPVIGPMILAGVLIDEDTEEEFRKLGVKDSKALTARKREELEKEIKKRAIAYEVTITHPSEIDGRASVGLNLNKIEAIKSAEIINKLAKKAKSKEVNIVIDCPSTNREAWKNYLMKHIENKELPISCEHKADVNHIACSAASVIAKTKRDAEIAGLKKKIGKDFGSGYPSDPLTIEFLKKYFKEHQKDGIFRETWGTVANHKKEKAQKKIEDY